MTLKGLDGVLCRYSVVQVQRALKEGADPTCEDAKHWTPLIWAACNGNEALCRLLISKGALTVRGSVKHTALHWAVFKGNLRVVWLLLKSNQSPDQRDQLANTCLHQAAAGGGR
jgi:ankyrin repeat protein